MLKKFLRILWPVRVFIFRTLLRLFPRQEWALFHLANAYAERGRRPEAVPLWLRACDRAKPRWAAAHNCALVLLEQGRPALAIPPLQRFVAACPGRADGLALLGKVLQKAQQLPEASEAYEQSLALDPGQDALRFMLALILEKTGHKERAASHYRLISDPKLSAQAAARIGALGRAAAD